MAKTTIPISHPPKAPRPPSHAIHPTAACGRTNYCSFQKRALHDLEVQGERQVLFIVDERGGGGKSTLCKYLLSKGESWACQGGATRDLQTAYDVKCRYAIFDMARCNAPEYWPWNFIENLKNGWFTTVKYRGRMRTFTAPRVMVLCNADVPRDKLSSDRYQVVFINVQ